jgi:hypothetical protein
MTAGRDMLQDQGSVTTGGNITLTATDDVRQRNNGVAITTSDGNLSVTAGDDVTQVAGSTMKATSGSVTIEATAGDFRQNISGDEDSGVNGIGVAPSYPVFIPSVVDDATVIAGGAVNITSGDDIELAEINTGAGVVLTAGGDIRDHNAERVNILAVTASVMSAGGVIGGNEELGQAAYRNAIEVAFADHTSPSAKLAVDALSEDRFGISAHINGQVYDRQLYTLPGHSTHRAPGLMLLNSSRPAGDYDGKSDGTTAVGGARYETFKASTGGNAALTLMYGNLLIDSAFNTDSIGGFPYENVRFEQLFDLDEPKAPANLWRIEGDGVQMPEGVAWEIGEMRVSMVESN